MKKIVLTGGGTAGHVTPNIALLPGLKAAGCEISYIGSYNGIEKGLIEAEGIPYYGISSGKLRRYIDIKNLSDPVRVIKGYNEALKLMRKLKPDVVFSKGGYVSVPVVLAASTFRIPVVIHESDMTPGLANRIAMPSATKICCNFPETVKMLPEGKAMYTGSPIREALLHGNAEMGRKLAGFNEEKPILMIVGGSTGAKRINEAIREALPKLLERLQVIHLCGGGNVDTSLKGTPGYFQMEYAKSELADIYAMADMVVSRAGANSICELLALNKPNLLIPLPAEVSRGDQILNSISFERQGFSIVLEEKELTPDTLLEGLTELWTKKADFIATMNASVGDDATDTITKLLLELPKKGTRSRRKA